MCRAATPAAAAVALSSCVLLPGPGGAMSIPAATVMCLQAAAAAQVERY
jgi:hypothetical protein